ncbi:MAG: SseB family protein [Gammaproteobacteria bacterium]|nr:SseB family protein [Gammaproteobacteria bacterium]
MNESFEPRNDLEKSLLDAQEGRIPGEQFMQSLLESQVYMPIYEQQGDAIGNIQLDNKAKPLSIKDESGDEFLILFTSPERAGEFVKDYPGYGDGGLLAEFSWIMEKMGVGFGISLNPNWPVGIDLEPEVIKQLSGG